MKSERGKVASVNISKEKGTVKTPVEQVVVDADGIAGDAHAGPWHRQISMLAQESIERFAAKNKQHFTPGAFAENITTRGIDLTRVAVLDRFRIGSAELEVSQIGKDCHGDSCSVYRQVGKCIMPEEGIFCRVIKPGTIRNGEPVVYVPRILRILIITLSDRASRGEYEDRSGPQIKTILEDFFLNKRWQTEIKTNIIPDDAECLKEELQAARNAGVDVIFTTGGTGVGPRDITPDVVISLADKTIPGIMEHIRLKFGRNKPNALLSRSVAAVFGQSLIYTLPGSVKAVKEYTVEILKTMEHLMFMLHDLDVH